jgi:hypothetical protein
VAAGGDRRRSGRLLQRRQGREGRRLRAAIDRGEPYRDDPGASGCRWRRARSTRRSKGLAWFLGFAVQYKGLSGNAAAGKERLLKARRKPPGAPDALAFPTGTGGRRDRSNLRERVLAPSNASG